MSVHHIGTPAVTSKPIATKEHKIWHVCTVRRIVNWKDRKQIYFLRCDYGSALGTKQINLTIPARQLISLLIFIMVIINTRNTTLSGLWQWRSWSNSVMLCKHTLQIIVERKALTQQLLIPVNSTKFYAGSREWKLWSFQNDSQRHKERQEETLHSPGD